MLRTILTNPKDKKALNTDDGWEYSPVLVTTTHAAANGSFKAVSRASAGTTIVTQPNAGGSIVLVDLILTTDKVNGATVTIHFTDGTNTIVIIEAVVTDAPCNIATSFMGHWHGWKDARIEIVTVGTVKATVACGYFKVDINHTQEYAEWNAER